MGQPDNFKDSLIFSESGNKSGVINDLRFVGDVQVGVGKMLDLGYIDFSPEIKAQNLSRYERREIIENNEWEQFVWRDSATEFGFIAGEIIDQNSLKGFANNSNFQDKITNLVIDRLFLDIHTVVPEFDFSVATKDRRFTPEARSKNFEDVKLSDYIGKHYTGRDGNTYKITASGLMADVHLLGQVGTARFMVSLFDDTIPVWDPWDGNLAFSNSASGYMAKHAGFAVEGTVNGVKYSYDTDEEAQNPDFNSREYRSAAKNPNGSIRQPKPAPLIDLIEKLQNRPLEELEIRDNQPTSLQNTLEILTAIISIISEYLSPEEKAVQAVKDMETQIVHNDTQNTNKGHATYANAIKPEDNERT